MLVALVPVLWEPCGKRARRAPARGVRVRTSRISVSDIYVNPLSSTHSISDCTGLAKLQSRVDVVARTMYARTG